jgi:glycosyltransferase involved in cell wall biosynthesis
VLPNGVDTDRWGLGPGGDDLVWSGRIVPEKGLHLALEVARRAGRRLVIAGRIGDVDYFETEVAPHLGVTAHYVGELRQPELAALVGHSGCALVTPVWEEPFGLVIAEALVTGTPVVSFAVGGVPEVVAGSLGAALVPAGDLDGMARAADDLLRRVGTDAAARRTVQQDAVDRFSLRARAAVLEGLYADVVASDLRTPGAGARAGATTDATVVGGRHRASSSLAGGLSAVRPVGSGRRAVTA